MTHPDPCCFTGGIFTSSVLACFDLISDKDRSTCSDLSYNNITGNIPPSLGSLASLAYMYDLSKKLFPAFLR